MLELWFLAVTLVMGQHANVRTKNYTTRDGLASNVVNCGLQDRQGYIWLGTNHGLTRYDGHRFVNFYVEDEGERLIEGITHIAEDSVKNVLLMSGKGYRLLCFDLGTMQFVSADGMEFPTDTDEEKHEQSYTERARRLGIDRGNKTNRRHDLHYAQLDDGRELFATIDNGIFIYDPQTVRLQHLSAKDENPILESDYINGILQDRSGGIWLLTTFAGVYRLELGEEAIRPYMLVPNVRSFAQLDDHQIAVGDMEGHVFSYNPDTRQSSILFDRGVRAYAVNKDSKGRIWIGTRGDGVWIIDHSAAHKKAAAHVQSSIFNVQSLPARQIYDIKFSTKGMVWIATLDGGLIEGYEMPDGSFFFIPHFQGTGIHEIAEDIYGRLWMATENGLLVYSVPSGEAYQDHQVNDKQYTDTLFNKGKAVCVCCAPDGTVWAGTNGYGLLKIDHSPLTIDRSAAQIPAAENNGQSSMVNVQYIQADNGLANNSVESVVCDKEGNVIVGTDQGISIVSSSDGSVHNIYSQNGLRADTYNENAILCTTNGRIFLGSLTGLVELRTAGSATTSIRNDVSGRLPKPHITCIEVNNKPRYGRLSGDIRLSHDENSLCFHFSSFAYQDLSSVVYSYWLEGVDNDWRPSTKESQALYTNLSPRHYRLHVRSRLAGTDWSGESLCDVYIAQPWYWTWWARAFYLLVIVLLVCYEWHQYQQRLSLRRQLDQRLAALYAVEQAASSSGPIEAEKAQSQRSEPDKEKEGTAGSDKEGEPSQKERAFLDKLDRLILENLMLTDLDVNFIAQEMCMSYSTLHRRIKSLAGTTANEYVRKHRLAKAMQLLHDGHNATEVSMLCGFNSPSYFTRCFKAEYGMNPSEVGA